MNELLERLLALDRPRRIAVYAGAFVVIALVYYWYVYSPAATSLAGKTDRVEQLQQEQIKKSRVASRLEEYRAQVKELDAQLRKAIAQLPDQKEIPDLLSTVSSLGRESGLEIVLFRQKPEVYQDFYAEVPVEMLVRGTYSQVTAFLAKVGELNRIVNVTDIAMRSPVVGENRVSIDTSCTAVTFRFLTEEERARIAAEKAKQQRQ